MLTPIRWVYSGGMEPELLLEMSDRLIDISKRLDIRTSYYGTGDDPRDVIVLIRLSDLERLADLLSPRS